jgi:hypothetical protein
MIIKKKCSICGKAIILDPYVRSPLTRVMIPLNADNGSFHTRLCSYVYHRARSIRDKEILNNQSQIEVFQELDALELNYY